MRGRSDVVGSDPSFSPPALQMYDPMASSSASEEPLSTRHQPTITRATATTPRPSQHSLGHSSHHPLPVLPSALLLFPALSAVPQRHTATTTRFTTSRPFRRATTARAVSPQRRSYRSALRLSSSVAALLALLLLVPPTVVVAQQCNPLQIYVYDDESQCESRSTPSAVGKLYADASCRATQVQSSQSSAATFLLPGRYSAECVSGQGDYGQVRFLQSGCTSSTCSSSSSSSTSCDREVSSPASYYSRLEPPVYDVQALNDNFICYTLGSNSDSIVFAIFGDCSGVTTDDGTACGNNESPEPAPSASTPSEPTIDATEQPTEAPIVTTSEPTPPPSPRPATRRPSKAPAAAPVADPSPTNDDEPTTPTASPPDDTDEPSPAPAPDTPQPIALATADPGPQASPTRPPKDEEDGDGGGDGRGPPPTGKEENPATTNNNNNSSTSNIGIIAGAVLGALLALAIVLAAGFYAGALRQRKKQSSTGQMSPTDPDHGGFGTTWIPATAASSSAAHSKEIVVDPNHQDDVSTLGTPWGVMSAGIGGATVVVEDGTVAQHSLAWDYKPHEPSLADDSQGTHTFVSAPTQTGPLTGGMMAGGAGAASSGSPRVRASSLLADDTSFEKLYDDDEKDYYDTEIEDDNPGSSSQGLRFTVSVPAGKLGMVIDNTPGSVPEVRALKPDSVLVSRGVLVGDYLEQVDGLDVRDWTCLQVSQMIQNKSGQRTRELVFYRKPRGSMGGAVYTISEL